MKKFFKNLFIFILIVIFITAFSSSYSSLNLDNLATVVAIAIDTSDTNNLQLSFQFTNASSVSESGTSEPSPSIIFTVDASSISSGINLMNSYTGKELSLSHCKLIAFSEELAQNDITDEIYTLINDIQIRPSTNIVITKSTAKTYIENSKPLSENLLTKYYEIFSNSSIYTGYTTNTTIGDFFNSIICNTCEPYAILGGINTESKEESTNINSQKDSSSKSSETSLSSETQSENAGAAVFKGGQLVGELNTIETLSLLATTNQVNGFLVSVPDPQEVNNYIDIYLTPIKNTSITVNLINGSPYIKLKYHFNGRIYSTQKNSNYLDPAVIENISKSCNNYLQSIFSTYLYKTSKEFQSDINGIGKYVKNNFLTTQEFENYKWEEKYKDSFFDVSVDCNVSSSFLLTET